MSAVSEGLFTDDMEAIVELIDAALLWLGRTECGLRRFCGLLRVLRRAQAADLRKPWAASSRLDQRPADPTSLIHRPHGTSSGTNPEDMRPAASL